MTYRINTRQSENKAYADKQLRDQNSWDEKFLGLLQRLDDYQSEKDNPKKQMVDMELDELSVPTQHIGLCLSCAHGDFQITKHWFHLGSDNASRL